MTLRILYGMNAHHVGLVPWQEILVPRNKGRRQATHKLRGALLQSGVAYQCNTCGMEPVWNGRRLVLQINHIDGNHLNDSKDNLEFLCPNCHSQTSTFGNKMRRPGEKADTHDLESCAFGREGAIPSDATEQIEVNHDSG